MISSTKVEFLFWRSIRFRDKRRRRRGVMVFDEQNADMKLPISATRNDSVIGDKNSKSTVWKPVTYFRVQQPYQRCFHFHLHLWSIRHITQGNSISERGLEGMEISFDELFVGNSIRPSWFSIPKRIS